MISQSLYESAKHVVYSYKQTYPEIDLMDETQQEEFQNCLSIILQYHKETKDREEQIIEQYLNRELPKPKNIVKRKRSKYNIFYEMVKTCYREGNNSEIRELMEEIATAKNPFHQMKLERAFEKAKNDYYRQYE